MPSSPRHQARSKTLSGIWPTVLLAKPVVGVKENTDSMRPLRFAWTLLFVVKFFSLKHWYDSSLAEELMEAREARRKRGKEAMCLIN